MKFKTFMLFMCTMGSIICLFPVAIMISQGIQIAPDKQEFVGYMMGVGIFLSMLQGSVAMSYSAEKEMFEKDKG